MTQKTMLQNLLYNVPQETHYNPWLILNSQGSRSQVYDYHTQRISFILSFYMLMILNTYSAPFSCQDTFRWSWWLSLLFIFKPFHFLLSSPDTFSQTLLMQDIRTQSTQSIHHPRKFWPTLPLTLHFLSPSP